MLECEPCSRVYHIFRQGGGAYSLPGMCLSLRFWVIWHQQDEKGLSRHYNTKKIHWNWEKKEFSVCTYCFCFCISLYTTLAGRFASFLFFSFHTLAYKMVQYNLYFKEITLSRINCAQQRFGWMSLLTLSRWIELWIQYSIFQIVKGNFFIFVFISILFVIIDTANSHDQEALGNPPIDIGPLDKMLELREKLVLIDCRSCC